MCARPPWPWQRVNGNWLAYQLTRLQVRFPASQSSSPTPAATPKTGPPFFSLPRSQTQPNQADAAAQITISEPYTPIACAFAPSTVARMRYLARVGLAAFVCLLSAVGTGNAASRFSNLTGTWTNPVGVGTTIAITQNGSAIRWTGGPNNRAWIQTFEGNLAGASFSGDFFQDAPGVTPPRYHGTIDATVLDSCHIKLLRVVQAGQPTVYNVIFTKQACTTRAVGASRLTLNLSQRRFILTTNGSCPSTGCVVADGAIVTFCNSDEVNYSPFTFSAGNRFGPPYKGQKLLHPGKCTQHRFVNPGSTPIEVKIYDAIHSQMRTIITVTPKR